MPDASRPRLRAAWCCLVSALAACGTPDLTDVSDRDMPRPLFGTAPPEFSGTLGIDNPNDPTNGIDLAFYPELTLVRVTVSGLTTSYWLNPDGTPGTLDEVFDARGRLTVESNCYENVTIQFSTSGTAAGTGPVGFGTCEFPGSVVPRDPLTTTTMVRGQGRAWWGGKYPCPWGAATCRYYQGDKLITIDPAEGTLSLTASAGAQPGTDVTFTARATPEWVEGYQMPFTIQAWRWVPDSGAASNPCSAPPANTNPAICVFTPPAPGTMYVDAKVNTAEQTRSARVPAPQIVVSCTPNPVLRGEPATCTGRHGPDVQV